MFIHYGRKKSANQQQIQRKLYTNMIIRMGQVKYDFKGMKRCIYVMGEKSQQTNSRLKETVYQYDYSDGSSEVQF